MGEHAVEAAHGEVVNVVGRDHEVTGGLDGRAGFHHGSGRQPTQRLLKESHGHRSVRYARVQLMTAQVGLGKRDPANRIARPYAVFVRRGHPLENLAEPVGFLSG